MRGLLLEKILSLLGGPRPSVETYETKKCVTRLGGGKRDASVSHHKRHVRITFPDKYRTEPGAVHVPSTTPQMKLPFFVLRFAAPFVSVIAGSRGDVSLPSRVRVGSENGPREGTAGTERGRKETLRDDDRDTTNGLGSTSGFARRSRG